MNSKMTFKYLMLLRRHLFCLFNLLVLFWVMVLGMLNHTF